VLRREDVAEILNVKRPIEAFHQDDLGDWVADLSCGHGQHVRHTPPFQMREWVLTPEGRARFLGAELDCVRCDRFELPPDAAAFQRTPEFTESTVPAALLADHATKPGVWGVLHVTAGQLTYLVEPPIAREALVEAGQAAVIVPEVKHRVHCDGPARFFVEFHRRPAR
jgi:tellurite methyltransferase